MSTIEQSITTDKECNPTKTKSFYSILSILCISWFAFCCYVTYIRWQHWDLGIDTAFWAQLLHRYSEGLGWTTTVMYEELLVLFKFHVHMLLYPLFLIYKIFPHPATLNVVMHLSHSVGAFLFGILVFKLCKRDRFVALSAAVVYLLFPQFALAQTTFDFSFRHFSTFFLPLIALLALYDYKKIVILVLAIFTLGSDELGLSAGFILFALSWLYPKNRKLYAISGVIFILYTAFLLKYGIAHHAMGRYSHFEKGILAIISSCFETRKFTYLIGIFGPLLFVPLVLFNPWMLAIVPGLAQNILSSSLDTNILGHHYSATLAAILLIANAYSLQQASLQLRKKIVSLQLVVVLLLSVSFCPTLPYLWDGADKRIVELSTNLAILDTIIPEKASVCAPPAVTTRFWNRNKLYYFPLHAIDSDYIVLPKYLPGYPLISLDELTKIDKQLRTNTKFSVIHENNDIRIFKRREI